MLHTIMMVLVCGFFAPIVAMEEQQHKEIERQQELERSAQEEKRWNACLISPILGQEVSDLVVKESQFGVLQNLQKGDLVIVKSGFENKGYTYGYYSHCRYCYPLVTNPREFLHTVLAEHLDSSLGGVLFWMPLFEPNDIAQTSQVPPLKLLALAPIVRFMNARNLTLEDIQYTLPEELHPLIRRRCEVEKRIARNHEIACILAGEKARL